MANRKNHQPLTLNMARILDANVNRAREGLRVLEDTARFLWNDSLCYRRLRSWRHELQRITQDRYLELVDARESEHDLGRKIKEGSRDSLNSVVYANLHRAQEAVRVLEEYSKVFSPKSAPKFKVIRYGLYQEEKRILKKYVK
jgi:thiamine-phosphate pyrophosphorylase